jgi:hypothetical protein
MKRSFKRKKDEPISRWLVRICTALDLSEEMTFILFDIKEEAYEEGLKIGQEIQKIKQLQENEKEQDQ